jgi:hypothetical protein
MTTSNKYTRRKHQRDNVVLLFHDSGTDPFSFWSGNAKIVTNVYTLYYPKPRRGVLEVVDPKLVSYYTRNGQVDYLTDDLHNFTTNAVTTPESYQICIVDKFLILLKESELLFDLEGPIPQNCQFQVDLLTILSQHCTNLKLHDEIISVIKSHYNE